MHAPEQDANAPVLIVTGASSGIGRALAIEAARKGYAVVLAARRAMRLDEVATTIRAEGGTCSTVVTDVRDPLAPQRLLDAARALGGRVDVIANIAGMGAPGTLLEQNDAEVAAQWEVHVAAPLRIARVALPALIATRGQLLFVGSGLARVPAPGFGAYAPAKAAIRAAAEQLRRELATDGVGVTYVDPGAVNTEFSEAAGMRRNASSSMLANAETVARRMLQGIMRRTKRVNAVPWQTAGVILGEWFPGLADAAMSRIVDSPEPVLSTVEVEPATPRIGGEAPSIVLSAFDQALEPVARRMERVKLSRDFIASLLIPDAVLDLHEVAMRWAGMPNKNERAAVGEVLAALAEAGFIQPLEDERWRVVRVAT